jgi:hypothetical protein
MLLQMQRLKERLPFQKNFFKLALFLNLSCFAALVLENPSRISRLCFALHFNAMLSSGFAVLGLIYSVCW